MGMLSLSKTDRKTPDLKELFMSFLSGVIIFLIFEMFLISCNCVYFAGNKCTLNLIQEITEIFQNVRYYDNCL